MVFIEESNRNHVFSCTGVLRYLFFLGKPAVIPSSEINVMQDHLKGVYRNIKVSTLLVGETHTISDGPFSGSIGRVVETDNTKIKLQLESLGMTIILRKQAA
jgi:transcription antitermination factor NusG